MYVHSSNPIISCVNLIQLLQTTQNHWVYRRIAKGDEEVGNTKGTSNEVEKEKKEQY